VASSVATHKASNFKAARMPERSPTRMREKILQGLIGTAVKVQDRE